MTSPSYLTLSYYTNFGNMQAKIKGENTAGQKKGPLVFANGPSADQE